MKSDYAFLLHSLERTLKSTHDLCLDREWSLAKVKLSDADEFLDLLHDWLSKQHDGENAIFMEPVSRWIE